MKSIRKNISQKKSEAEVETMKNMTTGKVIREKRNGCGQMLDDKIENRNEACEYKNDNKPKRLLSALPR